MKKVWKVRRVAAWDGWCSPCGRDDRPLVLTRSGPGGLRAWLTGHGDESRCLLLTCRICGQWQVVPRREEDDPKVVLVDDDPAEALAAEVRESVTALLAEVRAQLAEERAAEPAQDAAPVRAAVPAPRRTTRPQPVLLQRTAAGPVLALPVGDLPAPRVSPESVAAALSVLTAARAAAPGAGPARSRTTVGHAPASRSRAARRHGSRHRGPTPRRPGGPTSARTRVAVPAPAAPTSIALPSDTVLDLIALGHQVVLAPAS